jgi:hypothetical protein
MDDYNNGNVYDINVYDKYTIDKYYDLFNNFNPLTISGDKYKCHQDLIFIEFTPLERIYYKFNKKISKSMESKVNELFKIRSEYFFKLSNRSPKDILESDSEIEIFDNDHRTIKTEKRIKQLDILKIKCCEDINYLLNNSKRAREDIEEYDKDISKKLYFVFAEWKPNLGKSVEYRCFIKNNKLVGICLYRSEYYSSRSIIPIETIKYFVDQIINLFSVKEYEKYVLDCFIYNNDPNKVYFIELNPFEEYVNCFSFDYDVINNTDKLLVTL